MALQPRLDQLVAASDVLLTCGSGGVGKTTIAASVAAAAAAELDAKVLVLTVDPARRLATAMGLERFGNRETRVPDDAFRAAGVEPRGQLWAAMLDTKASWDDLVRRHAPDAASRDAILANPLYRNITATFTQSHDYIAMERLHELHASGRYDLIVVDTPPSRNAIDFLDAPARMAEFFSSRLLRWLIAPARSKLVNLASKPFYVVADRLLGATFLTDIAEFFLLFQSMYRGFVERARAVERTLRDPRTSFVVVTTLEAAPAQEAAFFCEELGRRSLSLGALVFNRTLPAVLDDRAAKRLADRYRRRPDDAAAELAAALDADGRSRGARNGFDPATAAHVLREVGQCFTDYGMLAARETELAVRLSRLAPLGVFVPHLDHDVASLEHVLEVGRVLWSP
ncbi:MAG: ArsA family ATPase [Acidimicrobiia bacterium]